MHPLSGKMLDVTRLGGHRRAKYITGTLLRTNQGRGWRGLLAECWRHNEGDLGEVQVCGTEIIVMLQGQLHVRRRGDGRLQHCDAVPGTIWLCPNGVREDMIHLYGAVRESIHLFLPAASLSRTALREIGVDPDKLTLHYEGGFRDPVIEQFARTIRAEMIDPSPAGKMIAETFASTLGVHVIRSYSNIRSASVSLPVASGALDPRRLRRVRDFIEAHLGEDLSIEALAGEACLSPFHFARAFKAATGTAPHRYLTDRRVERAKALIAEGELPLTEIANKCCISSQAYLSRLFERFAGTTPGEYRSYSGAIPDRAARAAWGSNTMELTAERHGNVLTIDVSGRIDATTAPSFAETVRNATKEGEEDDMI